MIIGVAGNIGVGKTTLSSFLGDRFGIPAYLEDVSANPFLEKFYSDPSRWGFHSEMCFLLNKVKQYKDIERESRPCIIDRTIYEERIFASTVLSSLDYSLYQEWHDHSLECVSSIGLLIYLCAPLETLLARIRRRNISFEHDISIDFVAKLQKSYDHWIQTFSECPIICLETTEPVVDKKSRAFQNIVQAVETCTMK